MYNEIGILIAELYCTLLQVYQLCPPLPIKHFFLQCVTIVFVFNSSLNLNINFATTAITMCITTFRLQYVSQKS